jgi:hypothetical protein
VAKGQRGAAIDVRAQRLTPTGRVSGSDGRSERALASGCAEDCGEACGRMHIASRAHTGQLGRQLTDTMVEHRPPAPSPPWAGRDGEGRSGSKGGEGPARGGDCGEAFGPMHTRCLYALLLPRHWLSIVPWPLRPLGQVGMAKVDRGSKGGEGPARGGKRRSPRKWVSFHPTHPWPCPLRRFQRCH